MQACLPFLIGALTGCTYDAGSIRPLLNIGTLFNNLGLTMTSICHEFWQLTLVQGVMIGLSDG